MTLRRSFLALLLALPAFALAVPYAPGMQDSAIQAGRDYRELPTPLPTASGKDRIEVREFFFYGCSHCYNLELPLHAWLKRKAADVDFVQTPAVLNKNWEPLARAYYVAEQLKVLDKTHDPLYAAIHLRREKLFEKEPIIAFFEKMGVPRKDVEPLWESTAIRAKVSQGDALARKYQVQGTPTLTVAGKYVVPSNGERTFAVVDFLLAKERAARAR
jgi:thiol:disulfide interchange protein DsbA